MPNAPSSSNTRCALASRSTPASKRERTVNSFTVSSTMNPRSSLVPTTLVS